MLTTMLGYTALDDVPRLPGAGTFGPAATASPDQLEAITRACVDDLLSAFGLGGAGRGRIPLELVSRIPARRLARQIAVYDGIVGEQGLAAGGAGGPPGGLAGGPGGGGG